MQARDDIVIDPANALPQVGAEIVLANRYGDHPIVRSLAAARLPVVFPLARSVTKAEKPPEGVAETMLVETSPEGWGETNLKKLDVGIKKDPATRRARLARRRDRPADEKKPDPKAPRAVFIGNSRFVTNGAIGNGGNGIFFANAVHWLAGRRSRSASRRRRPGRRRCR